MKVWELIWICGRMLGMFNHLYHKQGPRPKTRLILSANGPQNPTHILNNDVSDVEGILLARGLFDEAGGDFSRYSGDFASAK